jgi:hypothetical protein
LLERAHRWKAILAVEQMSEEERYADVAREERVAAASECLALALDLANHVHGECARPVKPEVVSRALVEDEEGVRVAGGAVAQP